MYYNIHSGPLAKGCDMCLVGAKAVIFITGLCRYRCFYCPVDRERFGRDVIYVNDVRADTVGDVVREVAASGAAGAAITGGDPLEVPERVVEVSSALKREFGRGFHIHLYTRPTSLNNTTTNALINSGVDEVRLHFLSYGEVSGRLHHIAALKYAGLSVGVEIPAIPGLEASMSGAINALAERGLVDFVNINELDVSDSNIEALRSLGYRVSNGSAYGSVEAAKRLMGLLEGVPVNICRSRTKDLYQIGARIFREAMFSAAPPERVQDDGTIEYTEHGVHPGHRLAGRIKVKMRLGGKYLEIA
ncbi:radical SAM protein [Thermoproteus sp. CP80]|uniref:radical SAM protein n=1 Tax=Thermoproteus sp. CP80 TaxID=1650659 RepID=UPI0009BE1E4A|nr:radical SAM protein [Thermoproteus sp. CP80]PLC66041.1 radical SAM protein [Thermoproteus sp. CP80]